MVPASRNCLDCCIGEDVVQTGCKPVVNMYAKQLKKSTYAVTNKPAVIACEVGDGKYFC
jgi:hypothetical protein